MNKGIILSLKDNIALCSGFLKVESGELVRDESFFNYGMALNLETRRLGVVMFSEKNLKQGDVLYRMHQLAKTFTSFYFLGFVLNVLGSVLNYGFIVNFLFYNKKLKDVLFIYVLFITNLLERRAPGILKRQSIYESVNTGIKVVDGLIPLGRGQRELIIGDRQTGKTAIAVDSILNQANPSIIFLV